MKSSQESIRVNTDPLDEIIDYLDEMAKPPSAKTVAKLDAVLAAAFAENQERAHLLSGSLKASGRMSSEVNGQVWTGRISYGGASPGPNSVVDYAIYELHKGGSHDFMPGLHEYDGRLKAVMNDHFDGL